MLKRLILIIPCAVIFFTAFPSTAHSWEFFDYFNPDLTEKEFLKKNTFDPYKDIQYLPPYAEGDMFASVNNLSAMRSPKVRKFIYLYLTKARPFLQRSLARCDIYSENTRKIFKEENLPDDLAFLPLLESGFNPVAVSRSGATGLWQFLAGTAKPLGLKNDAWIDERRHNEKATRAAARHLRGLHNTFHDWELALSAYNGGAGYVRRTMLKSGTKTLRELHSRNLLRDETSEFVPKFTALLIINKNRKLFGIDDEVTAEKREIAEYTFKSQLDLRTLCEKTATSIELIRKLNPELNTDFTPPYYKGYRLTIPAEITSKFPGIEDSLYDNKNLAKVIPYRVKKGENIWSISKKFGKKQIDILVFNKIADRSSLRAGALIYIP